MILTTILPEDFGLTTPRLQIISLIFIKQSSLDLISMTLIPFGIKSEKVTSLNEYFNELFLYL